MILWLVCLFVTNIYSVLKIFSESLFEVSQSITFAISQLIEFCNFPRLLSLWTKTVSSAKSLVFIKFQFGKSFINNKKNNGPEIELCGTPELIDFKDDLVFPPWMYCILLERYDCIN